MKLMGKVKTIRKWEDRNKCSVRTETDRYKDRQKRRKKRRKTKTNKNRIKKWNTCTNKYKCLIK